MNSSRGRIVVVKTGGVCSVQDVLAYAGVTHSECLWHKHDWYTCLGTPGGDDRGNQRQDNEQALCVGRP